MNQLLFPLKSSENDEFSVDLRKEQKSINPLKFTQYQKRKWETVLKTNSSNPTNYTNTEDFTWSVSELAFSCSKSTIEMLEDELHYVQANIYIYSKQNSECVYIWRYLIRRIQKKQNENNNLFQYSCNNLFKTK